MGHDIRVYKEPDECIINSARFGAYHNCKCFYDSLNSGDLYTEWSGNGKTKRFSLEELEKAEKIILDIDYKKEIEDSPNGLLLKELIIKFFKETIEIMKNNNLDVVYIQFG